MARLFYGPVAVTAPTPNPDDGTAIGFVSVALFVYRTRSGGAAESDLQTPDGAAISTVTPDSATGALSFLGPDGYTGSLWVADPAGTRWPVFPDDVPSRTGGVASVAVKGGTPQVGAVNLQLGAADLTATGTRNGTKYLRDDNTWTPVAPGAGFPTYPTQAAAQAGLAAGEFADGALIVIGP